VNLWDDQDAKIARLASRNSLYARRGLELEVQPQGLGVPAGQGHLLNRTLTRAAALDVPSLIRARSRPLVPMSARHSAALASLRGPLGREGSHCLQCAAPVW